MIQPMTGGNSSRLGRIYCRQMSLAICNLKAEWTQGQYYLVDAGFTNGQGFLAPYRGQRYHLSE
ncbi:protein ALP1-like [Senna tora]|uniref:Protein ALP1-like n=1 Tax=Senna tora TaxID=362788 RepID=A0A834WWB5_9FABA|nr:protein ALP1-like [Senna tora]